MKDILVLLIILVLPLVVFFIANGGLDLIIDYLWDKLHECHFNLKVIAIRQNTASVDIVVLYKEFRKVGCRIVYHETIRTYIYSYFRYHKHFSLNDFSCFVDTLQKETDRYFTTHPPMKDAYHLIESCTFREALLNVLDNQSIHSLLNKYDGFDAEKYMRYLYSLTKDDYRKIPFDDWAPIELFHLVHIENKLLGEESRLFDQDIDYDEANGKQRKSMNDQLPCDT